MNIGKAIKQIRKEKGLGQSELSEVTGISVTSLSQIETGLKRPSSKNLKKICAALDISEGLIYILATEESDVPAGKQQLFKTLFPTLRELLIKDELKK